jgi:hypothetical protein
VCDVADVIRVGRNPDPDRRIREAWAKSLAKHMTEQRFRVGEPMSRKQLQHALAERGIDVTLQAIQQWLAGATAPRPHVMVELGAIFGVPASSLFPLGEAAA